MNESNFIQAVPEEELPAFLNNVFMAAQESLKEIEHIADDFEKTHEYCVGTLSLIKVMNKIGQLGLEIPDITGNKQKDIEEIKALIYKIEKSSSKMLSAYGTDDDRSYVSRESKDSSLYKFEDNDFDRVQVLINELRAIVSKSVAVDVEHKSRLLSRLEKLQSELHKHVSDFDRFWGLVGEVGPAIGKFGEDTKPFLDRVRELMDIVTRTQSKKNGLLGDQSKQGSLENDSDSSADK